jgi:hypothetical protein
LIGSAQAEISGTGIFALWKCYAYAIGLGFPTSSSKTDLLGIVSSSQLRIYKLLGS